MVVDKRAMIDRELQWIIKSNIVTIDMINWSWLDNSNL